MLKTYTKGEIKDLYGKNTGVKLEVNWNSDDQKIADCKVIKMTLPGGKELFVKKEEFLSFLWLMGNNDEHMKMIPQTLTRSRWYETVLSVKATKDIRKGENLTFPIKLSMPDYTEEVIGNLQRKSGQIVVPAK